MQKSNIHNEKSGMLLPIAKALGIAVAAGIVLAAIFCFAALRFDDPEKVSAIFAYIALAAVAFGGGYLASKMYGEKGVLCGLVLGLSLAALMILLCFAFSLPVSPLAYAVSAACAVGLAMLGGKCAEKGSGKRKRPKKRR